MRAVGAVDQGEDGVSQHERPRAVQSGAELCEHQLHEQRVHPQRAAPLVLLGATAQVRAQRQQHALNPILPTQRATLKLMRMWTRFPKDVHGISGPRSSQQTSENKISMPNLVPRYTHPKALLVRCRSLVENRTCTRTAAVETDLCLAEQLDDGAHVRAERPGLLRHVVPQAVEAPDDFLPTEERRVRLRLRRAETGHTAMTAAVQGDSTKRSAVGALLKKDD